MKRTQFGWVFIIVIALMSGIVMFQNPDAIALVTFSSIAVIILILFYKITICVSEDEVCFKLGIGLIRGRYKLNDIIYCKPLHYLPLGWGIRLRPGIIMFNVSGNKAIQLEIRNKYRKVWIGTNVPEEIASYINSRI